MFTNKRKILCVWSLSVGFLFTVPVWAQITAGNDAQTQMSQSDTNHVRLNLQRVPHNPDGSTGTTGTTFNYHNALATTTSDAVHNVSVHDNASGENVPSGEVKQKVTEVAADPNSVVSNLPPTLTVSTAALLELHAMRKSAVDLCIQLPTKYRTHLPECAEIFKHEIRLQGLAKDHH